MLGFSIYSAFGLCSYLALSIARNATTEKEPRQRNADRMQIKI